MLTVHVRISDAATNRPTPVRFSLRDERGTYYAPFGRLTHFAEQPGSDVGGHLRLGTERFAYIDGACEVRLPAGNVVVEATKGPEYSPLRRHLTLAPGQISLRLGIDRWIDLRAEGWYSGDARAHALTPHAALLEAAAEDLAVVNLLAEETQPTADRPLSLPNLLSFSGNATALASVGQLDVIKPHNAIPLRV